MWPVLTIECPRSHSKTSGSPSSGLSSHRALEVRSGGVEMATTNTRHSSLFHPFLSSRGAGEEDGSWYYLGGRK
ncbi:nwd2 [Moniliophthora roreri]|nr:nwd2 [Moniliophthora roreri]